MDTGLLKQWPKAGPEKLWWKKNLGEGFTSVSVASDTIYVAGMVQGRCKLFALQMSGQPKWTADLGQGYRDRRGNGPRATPTVDDGLVYMMSGTGVVGCVRAEDGRKVWTRKMSELGGRAPRWGWSESVLIHQDKAVVTPGGGDSIVALDKKTGRTKWQSSGFRARAHYCSAILVRLGDLDTVVQGTGDGLFSVDARSGRLLWSDPWSKGNVANCPTPAYADGYVFWANGYRGRGGGAVCLKLSPKAGGVEASRAWSTKEEMICHHGGYIIHEGYIYGNNDRRGWICMDLKTGDVKWKAKGVGKGSLCFADGMLYTFAERSGVCALVEATPEGYREKGRIRVSGSGPSWAHPVVTGGRLYLRYAENLYCFDVRKK
jgi:outer membrane protein assembly factor BamB